MSSKNTPFADDPQMQKVRLGLRTENFVTEDPVGINLVERAHVLRIEALEGLAKADPTDTETIRRLQMSAMIPELLLSWLDEAISEGVNAEESIRAEDSEDE
jgi:hypothetical protein